MNRTPAALADCIHSMGYTVACGTTGGEESVCGYQTRKDLAPSINLTSYNRCLSNESERHQFTPAVRNYGLTTNRNGEIIMSGTLNRQKCYQSSEDKTSILSIQSNRNFSSQNSKAMSASLNQMDHDIRCETNGSDKETHEKISATGLKIETANTFTKETDEASNHPNAIKAFSFDLDRDAKVLFDWLSLAEEKSSMPIIPRQKNPLPPLIEKKHVALSDDSEQQETPSKVLSEQVPSVSLDFHENSAQNRKIADKHFGLAHEPVQSQKYTPEFSEILFQKNVLHSSKKPLAQDISSFLQTGHLRSQDDDDVKVQFQQHVGTAAGNHSRVSDHRGYASDSEDPMNWLEQQKAKLKLRRFQEDQAPNLRLFPKLLRELKQQQKLTCATIDTKDSCAQQDPFSPRRADSTTKTTWLNSDGKQFLDRIQILDRNKSDTISDITLEAVNLRKGTSKFEFNTRGGNHLVAKPQFGKNEHTEHNLNASVSNCTSNSRDCRSKAFKTTADGGPAFEGSYTSVGNGQKLKSSCKAEQEEVIEKCISAKVASRNRGYSPTRLENLENLLNGSLTVECESPPSSSRTPERSDSGFKTASTSSTNEDLPPTFDYNTTKDIKEVTTVQQGVDLPRSYSSDLRQLNSNISSHENLFVKLSEVSELVKPQTHKEQIAKLPTFDEPSDLRQRAYTKTTKPFEIPLRMSVDVQQNKFKQEQPANHKKNSVDHLLQKPYHITGENKPIEYRGLAGNQVPLEATVGNKCPELAWEPAENHLLVAVVRQNRNATETQHFEKFCNAKIEANSSTVKYPFPIETEERNHKHQTLFNSPANFYPQSQQMTSPNDRITGQKHSSNQQQLNSQISSSRFPKAELSVQSQQAASANSHIQQPLTIPPYSLQRGLEWTPVSTSQFEIPITEITSVRAEQNLALGKDEFYRHDGIDFTQPIQMNSGYRAPERGNNECLVIYSDNERQLYIQKQLENAAILSAVPLEFGFTKSTRQKDLQSAGFEQKLVNSPGILTVGNEANTRLNISEEKDITFRKGLGEQGLDSGVDATANTRVGRIYEMQNSCPQYQGWESKEQQIEGRIVAQTIQPNASLQISNPEYSRSLKSSATSLKACGTMESDVAPDLPEVGELYSKLHLRHLATTETPSASDRRWFIAPESYTAQRQAGSLQRLARQQQLGIVKMEPSVPGSSQSQQPPNRTNFDRAEETRVETQFSTASNDGVFDSPPTAASMNPDVSWSSYASSFSSSVTGQSSPSLSADRSSGGSGSSNKDGTPRQFIKCISDSNKDWYKPKMSREDVVNLLKDKAPGSFIIRDSTTFPGDFALALKVYQIPNHLRQSDDSIRQTIQKGDNSEDLVRHFLIESKQNGVRLKGRSNEPVFAGLKAFVYQHCLTPLALPHRLLLRSSPTDSALTSDHPDSLSPNSNTLTINTSLIYIGSVYVESLTGPAALEKAITYVEGHSLSPNTTLVHFILSSQGIVLTDTKRKLFFRRHYPLSCISFCGTDRNNRRWTHNVEGSIKNTDRRLFGFVSRNRRSSSSETPTSPDGNECHLFADYETGYLADTVVRLINDILEENGNSLRR